MSLLLSSSSQLDSLLASSPKDKLVIIDCSAEWCGPCKQISPVFERLSNVYRTATFCKFDVDKTPELAQRFRVTAMPTFLFLKNGTVVETLKGANPSALEAAIKKHSAGSTAPGDGGFPGTGHSLSGGSAGAPKAVSHPAAAWIQDNFKVVLIGFVVLGLFIFKGSDGSA